MFTVSKFLSFLFQDHPLKLLLPDFPKEASPPVKISNIFQTAKSDGPCLVVILFAYLQHPAHHMYFYFISTVPSPEGKLRRTGMLVLFTAISLAPQRTVSGTWYHISLIQHAFLFHILISLKFRHNQ